MKQWLSSLNYWKLATIRCLIYMSIAGIADFLTDTETWSQETWNNTGPFLKIRLLLGTWATMATILVAFLDNTMSRLKNGKSSGDTTLIRKEDIKP